MLEIGTGMKKKTMVDILHLCSLFKNIDSETSMSATYYESLCVDPRCCGVFAIPSLVIKTSDIAILLTEMACGHISRGCNRACCASCISADNRCTGGPAEEPEIETDNKYSDYSLLPWKVS